MTRAAIYARFSSDKQNERSIADQFALCRSLCEREGLHVVATFDDRAISGAATANRPGWLSLMHAAASGRFDVVVAEALDRISRDQADLAAIHKRLAFAGISIITAQDGAVGKIHVGVKGLLGALYLEDLAHKTRRGQSGGIRAGRHMGGRSYGYRPVAGSAGALTIDQTEAAIVRRIFSDYLDGHSPRAIAAALNRAGIKGPRGGRWNASAIGGSRKRANGVLQNRLYNGELVWNRQRFIKDPESGRRVSRPNPESEWMVVKAEQLRIVDAETFAAVKARRAATGGEHRDQARRPRHLLSGLLECGRCGSGFVVLSRDKRGPVLGCSRRRESGTCDNRRTVGLAAVERRVLEGIDRDLAAPELIAEFTREYNRMNRDHAAGSARRRADLERRLSDAKRQAAAVVDLMIAGKPNAALRDRLEQLEAERAAIEQAIEDEGAPIVELHPNAGEQFARKAKGLKGIVAAGPAFRDQAMAMVRDLVDRIVIHSAGPREPVELEIRGGLAELLRFSAGARPESAVKVVAGARYQLQHRLAWPAVWIRL